MRRLIFIGLLGFAGGMVIGRLATVLLSSPFSLGIALVLAVVWGVLTPKIADKLGVE